jgi:CCR4-NOT complex subunit CAF16
MTTFNKEYKHSVDVKDLSFTYGGPPIIEHLDLQLNAGNRCILVGANGAGKTTLLRILAGKRMIPGAIKVLGKDAFLDAPTVSVQFRLLSISIN